jgi:hypothetical protein
MPARRLSDESDSSYRSDLPISADVDTLANFVQTVNFGLTVQASTGSTRKDLLCVVAAALRAWPK